MYWEKIKVLLISLAVSFLLLEFGLYIMVESDYLSINRPTYSLDSAMSRFWVEINKDFGVWHQPNSRYRHTKSCFDVEYNANSYGARDVEREIDYKGKRVIVLGDSFIEGYGITTEKRLTNLLEKDTKLEHLNFGTSGHFGTTQYFLMYKTLAKKFSHTSIIVGIFPYSDFGDDDYNIGRRVHSDRYRVSANLTTPCPVVQY